VFRNDRRNPTFVEMGSVLQEQGEGPWDEGNCAADADSYFPAARSYCEQNEPQ
jgi:hypothetical protein